MKVYKVCSVHGDELRSCCLREAFPKECRLTYKIGCTTIPKIPGSKLFAFTNYSDAYRFHRWNYNHGEAKIFEAEATGVRKPSIKQLPLFSNILTYWKLRRAKKRTSNIETMGWEIPRGTVWCDSIQLIKEV